MPDRVFREHLDQLANVHGIRVTYLDRRSGEWPHAHPLRQPPEVVTFEPTDRRRYLCGLHEMGHVLGDFARTHTLVERCGPGVDLVEEADAWDWALNATRVDVSTTDVNYILELLQHDAVGHGAAHAFGVDLVPGHLSDRYRECLQRIELQGIGERPWQVWCHDLADDTRAGHLAVESSPA